MAMTAEDMATAYPLPGFRFRVSVKGQKETEFCCTNVSGMEIGYEYATYRDGCGGWMQIPGLRQEINISLKRGLFRGHNEFYAWLRSINHNSVEACDLIISLTDESGETPLITWTVLDAKPKKLGSPTLDASSNEIAVEEMSLTATHMTIDYD